MLISRERNEITISLVFRENAQLLRGNAMGISRERNNIRGNAILFRWNAILFHMTLQGLGKFPRAASLMLVGSHLGYSY